jgi:DNA ligase 1
VRLTDLAETSRTVGQTQRRRQKIATLAACLQQLPADEIEIGVDFLSGETRQRKLGVGPATIFDVRPGVSATAPSLTLTDVDAALHRIAIASGAGSQQERRRILAELFTRATEFEQQFLLRLLLGELRQGALAGLMVDAIAEAAAVALPQVRRAAMLAGNLGSVAQAALTKGGVGLKWAGLTLFKPLHPMLAQPAEDLEDAMTQLGMAALEWKLDGARVQVHRSGDEVRVFTRSLNEVTLAVPEIVEVVLGLSSRQLILDGETIALRPDGSPRPFQVTMQRFGRKLDIAATRAQLPLSVMFFDCLHADGRDLIDLPAEERFAALRETLPESLLIPRLITDDLTLAQSFFEDALARGHEGVMAKSLDAPYEAGGRGSSWLKVKQAQTLDLVVLAAEWGHGRRRGWLSNLHLGARDPDTDSFVMLGKTFKGLTDETLAWQTDKLLALESGRDQYCVYVRPELVVEIAVNEIQASPQYPGGMALRFARVKRYRPDKKPEQADTIAVVRALFERKPTRG